NAEDPVPMAGVPYHAIGGYLRTLVERGFKVAIAEQMESPEEARKRKGPNIVHREVVRIVTPGALLDEEHLRGGEPNYLVALIPGARAQGLIDGGERSEGGGDDSEALDPAARTRKPSADARKLQPVAASPAAPDSSSSELTVTSCRRPEDLRAERARLSPREILAARWTHAWLRAERGSECPALATGDSLDGAVEPQRLIARIRRLYEEGGTKLG